MSVAARHGLRRALGGGVVLLGIAGLAACSPEMQARSASAPIGSLDDWHFGGQSMQPGYLYNQHSLGATGPQYRRGDMAARERVAPADFAVASLHGHTAPDRRRATVPADSTRANLSEGKTCDTASS